MILLPWYVSLTFVVMPLPTTIEAFETLLTLFLMSVIGKNAHTRTITPTKANFQELYNSTAIKPIEPVKAVISVLIESTMLLEAVSGSDKNLEITSPEEFSS